jgi:chloride channel protein, CIC family
MEIEQNTPPPSQPLNLLWFSLLAILVGVVAGIGAVLFRGLIALIHNLLFVGKWSVVYDANLHTPASPWGIWVILVPVLGAAGVAFLVQTFAPEAKGHGVPEVMDAIYYNRGRIRPVVAVVKSLASALSIGSGGAVGREGPIIQIGSSFGSTIGQWLRVPAWQRIALIAGGAGAGIAATFNTPVGGVLFALEMMMHEVSARTLVPVAIATATGTYVGRLGFGQHPSFVIPALETPYFHPTDPLILLAYVGLGLLMGGVSTLFIKAIYATENFFEQRVGGSYYRQHLLGMLLVGLIMYGLMVTTGHYYVEGVGYSTVQEILSSAPIPLLLLVGLFGLKLLATAVTLGSGASGGIFSPALFLGATLGAAYGLVLDHFFPGLGVSPAAFAVAGMAGVVGGATGAAMAAIIMIFEMTLDYNVIVPMTITVALSYGIRKALCRESIYTMKLARRGHFVPEALHASLHLVQRAARIMDPKFGRVAASRRLDEFARQIKNQPDAPSIFLAMEEHRIVGYLRRESVLASPDGGDASARLSDLASRDFVAVTESATFMELTANLRASGATLAIVTKSNPPGDTDGVLGVITKARLGEAVIENPESLEN